MKASYQWICSFLPGYTGSAEEMADQLTFSGTEVEETEPSGDDFLFELGVTSNRVDSLCHLGLAREVAAVSGLLAQPPEFQLQRHSTKVEDLTSIRVEDKEGCPRFTAQVIEGVKVGPSPQWMKDRLEALGLRSVNNVVDITNYVLYELNQPLHAYDLDCLKGERIVVRRAKAGESLQAINATEYKLDAQDVVIADAERVVGIAGVMGGLDSEVSEKTTRILLESASFHAPSVRRTSARLQLRSDASFRFERGVDRAFADTASHRAAALILECCGGQLAEGIIDIGGAGEPPKSIGLRFDRIDKVCGIEVPHDRVRAILSALDCEVQDDAKDLAVTPPSWRRDLTREIDLIEEVIRLYGLHHIPVLAGMPVRPVALNEHHEAKERTKDRLIAAGCVETVTSDFVEDGLPGSIHFLVQGDALVVRNPVRKGEGTLRRSLLPSLLKVRKTNQDQGNEDVRLFELSNVRCAKGENDVEHLPAVGCLLDGDLRDARGLVESLLKRDAGRLVVKPSNYEGLEPGTCGELWLDNQRIGVMGQPSRKTLKAFGVKSKPSFAEVDLRVFMPAVSEHPAFTGMPKFPSMVRDLALVLDENVAFEKVKSVVSAENLACLEELSLFDVFRGKPLQKDQKSLAIRLVFRAPDRTLRSEEVDEWTAAVTKALDHKCGASLRGT